MQEENINKAVEKVKGPCLILAGAGTGKTHTITKKIIHLIKNRFCQPEKLLCITFSNEAANNLASRVRKALQISKEKEPLIKTFHSFSAMLLRKYGRKISIPEDFEILDTDEEKVLLHSYLKVPPLFCSSFVNAISKAKDIGVSLSSLESYLENKIDGKSASEWEKNLESLKLQLFTGEKNIVKEKKSEIKNKISEIKYLLKLLKFVNAWRAYERIKEKHNYQDYSDLNANALSLLKNFPEIADDYDCIIVDEFQDTNKIQLELLFLLGRKGNITVVGDLNQSIYCFRGAYRENLELFKKNFEITDKEIFSINSSFRSTDKILRTARASIKNNYMNEDECMNLQNAYKIEGEPIQLFELKNDREEARKTAEIIQSEILRGTAPESMCVIYRSHQQGKLIKKALEMKSLRYCSVNKSSLLNQFLIRVLIKNIEFAVKAGNSSLSKEDMYEILFLNNFGDRDMEKINESLKKERETTIGFFDLISSLEISEIGKAKAKLIKNSVVEISSSLEKPLSEIIKTSIQTLGFESEEKRNETALNLKKFSELAEKYSKKYHPAIESFLNYLKVLKILEIGIDCAEIEAKGIKLMTAHAAKGLEYKVVIITALAENKFPINGKNSDSLFPPEIINQDGNGDIEEERRLFYVSCTRSKERLYLTYAKRYGEKEHPPSRFLEEINYKSNPDIVFNSDTDEKFKEFGFIAADKRILSEAEVNNFKERRFSPTALLTFCECQKKFEYKYIYGMHDMGAFSLESAHHGSFVHLILEKGVKGNFRTLKEFIDLSLELHDKEEWKSVELQKALFLIQVFYARNKNKYNEKSLTEEFLEINLGGFNFIGIADRIDFSPEGIEIVDYKIGSRIPPSLHRKWQLGYYALSATKLGKIRRLTLDVLNHEKPFEYILDEKGNASEKNSGKIEFNINEIKEELLKTAGEIASSYSNGFSKCPVEKNCPFCRKFIYG